MKSNSSLAAGVIIEEADSILLVYEKGYWGLPKGELENGEAFHEAAIREAMEETGLKVSINNVAFVTEFKAQSLGHYIQVFYEAKIISGNLLISDPDEEIEGVQFIPKQQLRNYMKFRPRLLPLEQWLKTRTLSYHYFDLDREEYFI